MYPSAEDNYGVDACSVLCLDTSPPVLVMATCDSQLHHCLILPATQTDSNKVWGGGGGAGQDAPAPVAGLASSSKVEGAVCGQD